MGGVVIKAHTLIFSPTQTGATVASKIQKSLSFDLGETLDITKAPIGKTFDKDDLVIIAMPVYGGRLPAVAVERFKMIKGNGAKVVAVAIYGNAKLDDALLELTNVSTDQGFDVIAAASFIGEHSFTMKKFPIAVGRPDAKDLEKAKEFAAFVCEKIDNKKSVDTSKLPGSSPYVKETKTNAGVAVASSNDNCTKCGICETFCPVDAITVTENGTQTDGEKCIWCAACVKSCTSHARVFSAPRVEQIAETIYTNFKERQEPKWY